MHVLMLMSVLNYVVHAQTVAYAGTLCPSSGYTKKSSKLACHHTGAYRAYLMIGQCSSTTYVNYAMFSQRLVSHAAT